MSKISLSELDNLYEDEGANEHCVECGKKTTKKVIKGVEKIKKTKIKKRRNPFFMIPHIQNDIIN
jgi:PHP family Zn ribbon phosphoesterase